MNITSFIKGCPKECRDIENRELNDFLESCSFGLNFLETHQYKKLSRQLEEIKSFKGIESKFSEVTNPTKLSPIISEINFAVGLAVKGFEIEMINDGHKRFLGKKGKIPSPDFIAKKEDSEYFVEVAQLKTYNTDTTLRKHLEEKVKDYPLKFWIKYSAEHSIPSITSDDFPEFEDKIKSLADKIGELLPKHNDLPEKVTIDGCDIYFEQLSSGEEGYIGGPVSGCVRSTEKYMGQIKMILEKKYKKTNDWKDDNYPSRYIIALDLEEFDSLLSFDLLSLLYGERTDYNSEEIKPGKPSCYYSLKKILESKRFLMLENEYKELLYTVGFDLGKPEIVKDLGIFMEEKNEFSGLTGIIVGVMGSFQYLPHPYSIREDAKLLKTLDYPIVPQFFRRV